MKKFKDAFNGLFVSLKEKSVKTQVILAIMSIIGGLIIKLNYFEWLCFVICIVGVISLEIINSVIERLCDLYSLKKNNKIKDIKDMSSAAVLVFCIGAFIICIWAVYRRLR